MRTGSSGGSTACSWAACMRPRHRSPGAKASRSLSPQPSPTMVEQSLLERLPMREGIVATRPTARQVAASASGPRLRGRRSSPGSALSRSGTEDTAPSRGSRITCAAGRTGEREPRRVRQRCSEPLDDALAAVIASLRGEDSPPPPGPSRACGASPECLSAEVPPPLTRWVVAVTAVFGNDVDLSPCWTTVRSSGRPSVVLTGWRRVCWLDGFSGTHGLGCDWPVRLVHPEVLQHRLGPQPARGHRDAGAADAFELCGQPHGDREDPVVLIRPVGRLDHEIPPVLEHHAARPDRACGSRSTRACRPDGCERTRAPRTARRSR